MKKDTVKKDKFFALWFETDLKEKLEEEATRQDRSIAQVIRMTLRQWLPFANKNLSDRHRAWFEIIIEFENRRDEDIKHIRNSFFGILEDRLDIDAHGIWKRYS